MELTFHHIGIAVKSIGETFENYKSLFPKLTNSNKYFVSSQKVNVCFLEISKNVKFELIEPAADDSPVNNLLKKGINYYHCGYTIKNIHNTILELEEKGYKPLSIFESEAYNGKKCCFMFSPEGHLIELIEK